MAENHTALRAFGKTEDAITLHSINKEIRFSAKPHANDQGKWLLQEGEVNHVVKAWV